MSLGCCFHYSFVILEIRRVCLTLAQSHRPTLTLQYADIIKNKSYSTQDRACKTAWFWFKCFCGLHYNYYICDTFSSIVGSMVAQWLVLLPHGMKVLRLTPPPGYFLCGVGGFPPASSCRHAVGDSKLPIGLNGSPCVKLAAKCFLLSNLLKYFQHVCSPPLG